ncbi:hypothetical protein TL16_g03824 [Triparma laevis f. inornata]|uniref:RRM domain-containing protein n=1 Tax=Triparma laevis f. inornata TaxID=1714386 RepID=A0A9W7A743_9STRA|nr:hypothetical protein TL16_g03824 [Triparma laevis f. inornata]
MLPLLAPYITSILPFPDEIVSDMITYAISEGNIDVLSKSDKNVDFNLLLEHLTPFLADDAKPVVTKLYKALSGERDSDGIPMALGGGTRRSKKINIVVRNLSYDCDEEMLKKFLEHAGCKTWKVDMLKDDEGKGRGMAFCEVDERGFEIVEKGVGKLEGREVRVERKRERGQQGGGPQGPQGQQREDNNRFREDRGDDRHCGDQGFNNNNGNNGNNGRFRDERRDDYRRDDRDRDRRAYENNNDGSIRPKKRSRWGPQGGSSTAAPANPAAHDTTGKFTPPPSAADSSSSSSSSSKRPRFTSPPQQPKIAKGPSGENAKGFESGWTGRESAVENVKKE